MMRFGSDRELSLNYEDAGRTNCISPHNCHTLVFFFYLVQKLTHHLSNATIAWFNATNSALFIKQL